ncbi:uncharacterized protein lmln isoform X3 [Pseudoliparis swirei]|uniref:uncharacterized protein lmln isoform X3 n=1 Tax=Pseudoliparis swirei TaxID=2059687 RepID=UPI0024BE749C|nr:uncharacterized protein lmln isoform X3 [Pseudoliparis swirei]
MARRGTLWTGIVVLLTAGPPAAQAFSHLNFNLCRWCEASGPVCQDSVCSSNCSLSSFCTVTEEICVAIWRKNNDTMTVHTMCHNPTSPLEGVDPDLLLNFTSRECHMVPQPAEDGAMMVCGCHGIHECNDKLIFDKGANGFSKLQSKDVIPVVVVSLVPPVLVAIVATAAFYFYRTRRPDKPGPAPRPAWPAKHTSELYRAFDLPRGGPGSRGEGLGGGSERTESDDKEPSPNDDIIGYTTGWRGRPNEPPPIRLEALVGKGRFAEVWRASLPQGEKGGVDSAAAVAVKVFPAVEFASWRNECFIFSDPTLEHDNVVRFLAAQERGHPLRKYWLVLAYHSLGNLQDFLKANILSWEELVSMAGSIARGLAHLHSDATASGVPKVPVAHRDLKSSNVVVKSRTDVALCDFGLALRLDLSLTVDDYANTGQVGTARYMAPEVLESRVNLEDLEAFKQMDVYSMALVHWEMASRCRAAGEVKSYEPAFGSQVCEQPCVDSMRDLVLRDRGRPDIPTAWTQHEGMDIFCSTVTECWDHDPEARLTAHCVVERFNVLQQEQQEQQEEEQEEEEEQQQEEEEQQQEEQEEEQEQQQEEEQQEEQEQQQEEQEEEQEQQQEEQEEQQEEQEEQQEQQEEEQEEQQEEEEPSRDTDRQEAGDRGKDSDGDPPPSLIPQNPQVVHHVHLKPERLTKRSSPDDLRLKIKVIYDYSVDRLPADQRRLVKEKLFPPAIDYLQQVLSVRRRSGPVLLSRQCATNQYLRKRDDPHRYCQDACADVTRCGPVVVPQHHLQQCKVCSESGKSCGPLGAPDGPGVEGADFVLYVSGVTTERCGQENIVAYAAYCQLEAELDRPIAGYANLCPAMISSQPQELEGMLSTVKHEIIHALGFSAGLFAFYHDDEGKPLTPRFASGLPAFNESLGLYQWSEAVIRRVSRLWDIRGGEMVRHQVHVLVTPRVVEEARRHFNCPILEGMELENQGGTGTELNHWEKRLLENEAMTGSHTQNRVFSRLTLALLEDSGWYRADYSRAQRLDWGRGLGCDFVMKSCKFWMDRQRQSRHPVTPYCDTLRASPLQLTCRQDQLAVAVCNLQKHQQELPLEYQYFEAIPDVSPDQLPMFGGAVEIADFCPFSQEFSWHLSGEYQRNSHCRVPENQPDWGRNYGAERYGPDSACVTQKSAFVMEQCSRKMTYPDWGAGCYQRSPAGALLGARPGGAGPGSVLPVCA